jgi:membrane-bound lytic murein transglycosylase D
MTHHRLIVTMGLCAFAAACVRSSAPTVAVTPNATPAQSSAPSPAVAPQIVVAQQSSDSGHATSSAPSPDSARATHDSAQLSATDVAQRAQQLFGDTLPARADAAGSSDSAAAGPSWDIDVRSYEAATRVARYVQIFSGTARERIEARLGRGTRYEPMIRAQMRAGGLPEDMYYLALIESGFDPNAYSRAAAVGMWQFMTSTGRDMGLRVDWWIDERRDPVKSTVAAVRFIRGLQDQFGSLYLAAAAYNGGPGRIARGLTRYAGDLEGTTGDDLFFALADKDALRNETRDYVPQLIAAALVAKEPERYGLTITAQPVFVYDSAWVGRATPLAAIARAAGASVAQIQELNPQILRGVTPPKDSTMVRLPRGAADSFAVALAALPDDDRVGLHIVESKKGQSLLSIAHKYDLTSKQLALYNPKLQHLASGRLVAGQTVLVPTPAVVAAAAHIPDPAIERYEHYASSRAATLHVVASGETLSGIAKKYHTTTSALMKANGLRRALIFPGQALVVRGSPVRGKHSSAKVSAKSSTSASRTTSSRSKTVAKTPTKKAGAGKSGAHHDH